MTAQAIEEEWRDIPGFEGLYQASSLGRVRSLYFSPPRVLSPGSGMDGYPIISLYKDKRRHGEAVHRIVCRTFNGPGNILHREVAHLDGVRTNCRADNLRWVSKVENHFHKRFHGTHPAGERHPRARLTECAVKDIRSRLSKGERYAAIAERYGVSRHTIEDISRRRRWKHVA